MVLGVGVAAGFTERCGLTRGTHALSPPTLNCDLNPLPLTVRLNLKRPKHNY